MNGEVIMNIEYPKNVKPCKKCGYTRPYIETVAETPCFMYRIMCKCGEHTAKKFTKEKATRIWNKTQG